MGDGRDCRFQWLPTLFVVVYLFPTKENQQNTTKISVFEAGNITVYSMETKASFRQHPRRGYQRFPGLLKPSNHEMMYMVNGKPYISMYRATINASTCQMATVQLSLKWYKQNKQCKNYQIQEHIAKVLWVPQEATEKTTVRWFWASM